jgi:hypothetical protein
MKSFEGNKELAKKFVLLMRKGRNHFSSSRKRDFIRKMLLTNLHKVPSFSGPKHWEFHIPNHSSDSKKMHSNNFALTAT